MNARKSLIGFVLAAVLAVGTIVGFNIYTNPFGVFADTFYDWPSYNITENPRTAKIKYLDENHGKYNAYIIGSSGASAFPIDTLDSLNGKKNYNLFYYGADMYDSMNTVDYIIENYGVEEILLPVSFSAGTEYHTLGDDLNYTMDYRVEHTSPYAYWTRYLFAHPQFGIDKIKAAGEDSYFQKKFDVFIAEEGSYDKSLRDVERIGAMDEYIENFPSFADQAEGVKSMEKLDQAMDAVREIKEKCDGAGVKLTVIMYPVTDAEFNSYQSGEISAFYSGLSSITEYWDFTLSSISGEPRYFYDPAHFRNDVGRMMMYRMYGEEGRYIPDDFGTFVEKGEKRTYEMAVEGRNTPAGGKDGAGNSYAADVPVLMLHHIGGQASNSATITEEKLKSVLEYLEDEGFDTVLHSDLRDFVTKGVPLPDKPVMITFDDGYESNYDKAYPLLEANGQKATIFPIGSSFGKDTYKETGIPIHEHFSVSQAREMLDSGIIDIGCHSFDMHQSESLEENKEHVHNSMVRLGNESEKEYIELVRSDFEKFNQIYADLGRGDVRSLAFPLGEHDKQLTALLSELGIESTFTITRGNNTLIKGLPQTLYNLRRNNIDENTDMEKLFEEIR